MLDRFRLDTAPLAHPDAVVAGDTWRISVLTDGLLRLEYSADGVFEDRSSAFALNRGFDVPEFEVKRGDSRLELTTARLHLVYDLQPFSTSGLSIQVRGNISSYHSVWRPGQPVTNLGGTVRTLDEADGAVPLDPGILSKEGYAVVDDSASLVLQNGWVAPRDGSRTDLYFFGYGRDYRDALVAFYALSGPTPLLPRFALGNWWSRYYAYSADEYRELMTRFERERIPFSVCVIDMDWHEVDIAAELGSGWTGYTWNRELFPDAAGFLAWLHERGYRVTLNVHPADGVRSHEQAYGAMAEAMGIDPSSGAPVSFDVTDAAFLTAYFEVLHHPLEKQGVDFWWLDWQSGSASAAAGIDPLWVLNHFHFLDSARDGKRPLTFSRYAGIGSHRYPVGFSGDTIATWESLHFQPYFTATASNVGYGWWSHDIGGHIGGAKNDELALRWLQFGVFSPIMRLHSSSNEFNSKEPWRYSDAVAEAMREFLRLRDALVPYLHSMNHRAAFGSSPLIQPMYWEHPWEDDAYEVANQYLFGTELLVAPITAPRHPRLRVARVKAWLPDGTWVDFFTGRIYRGGRQLYLHRALDAMPVLARAGAIVPTNAGSGADNPAHLDVRVFAGADGAFELREDDGTGAGGDPDRHAVTRYALDWAASSFSVRPGGDLASLAATRRTDVTFVGFARPSGISVRAASGPLDHEVAVGAAGFTVRMPPLAVAESIEISFEMQRAANDPVGDVFALLDAAQIDFDLKTRVIAVVRSAADTGDVLSAIQALDVEPELLSALTEILTADGK